MPKGRPFQPRADEPIPVRYALIDDRHRFRSLHANISDAMKTFIQFKFADDEVPERGNWDALLTESGWTVQQLTKPWLPVTDGFNRAGVWPDRDPDEGYIERESFDIFIA